MKSFLVSLQDARTQMSVVAQKISAKAIEDGIEPEIKDSIASIKQYFDIIENIDSEQQKLNTLEITEIGNHGLLLIDKLIHWCEKYTLTQDKRQLDQVALIIANWIITHHGQIENLPSIVDGLAQLANTIKEPEILKALAMFMGTVIQACTDRIKNDFDTTDMNRPWRILNINRGIVATRSGDEKIMQNIFEELLKTMPYDAPLFFKEGMAEMVRLNYPKEVRQLMQKYLQRSLRPHVH